MSVANGCGTCLTEKLGKSDFLFDLKNIQDGR